ATGKLFGRDRPGGIRLLSYGSHVDVTGYKSPHRFLIILVWGVIHNPARSFLGAGYFSEFAVLHRPMPMRWGFLPLYCWYFEAIDHLRFLPDQYSAQPRRKITYWKGFLRPERFFSKG